MNIELIVHCRCQTILLLTCAPPIKAKLMATDDDGGVVAVTVSNSPRTNRNLIDFSPVNSSLTPGHLMTGCLIVITFYSGIILKIGIGARKPLRTSRLAVCVVRRYKTTLYFVFIVKGRLKHSWPLRKPIELLNLGACDHLLSRGLSP